MRKQYHRGVSGEVSAAGFLYEASIGGGFFVSKDGKCLGKVVKVGAMWRAHLPGGVTAKGASRDQAVLKALKRFCPHCGKKL